MNKVIHAVKNIEIQTMILLGVLLRVILMPFFAHPDIQSTYTRAYSIAFQGENIFSYDQHLSHWIEAIWIKVVSIITGSDIFTPFSNNPDENSFVLLNLFVYKLPYLAFDIGVMILLYILSKNLVQKKSIMAFYIFNPFVLFAVYIFGRYETIPLFFLMLAIYFVKNEKTYLSSVIMGLSILTRFSMVMLLPIYIILVGKNIKEKVSHTVLVLAPYFSISVLKSIFLEQEVSNISGIATGQHANYLLDSGWQINEVLDLYIYPFFIGYGFLMYFGYKLWKSQKNDWELVTLFFALTFLLFYITSFYHPQYIAWFVPFLAIFFFKEKIEERLVIFFLLCFMLPIILLSWGDDILMGVFTPISSSLGDKDLSGVVSNYYPANQLASIARTLVAVGFSIIAAQISIPFVKKLKDEQ